MAFCKNCGAEVSDTAVFCKNCGCKVNPSSDQSDDSGSYDDNIYGYMPGMGTEADDDSESDAREKIEQGVQKAAEKTKEGMKKGADKVKDLILNYKEKCKSDKRYLIGGVAGIAVVVLAIILAVVISAMPKKVNVSKCMEVTVEGFDEHGYANVEFSMDDFARACLKAKGVNLKAGQSYYEGWSRKFQTVSIETLMGLVQYEIDNQEDLSNGDTVVVKIKFDNEKAKKYGLKFTGDTYKYKVDGLEELEGVDPFEGLKVTFEGVAPNAYPEFDYEGSCEFLDSSMFYCEESDENGYDVGDKVTVYVSMSEEEAENYGYGLEKTKKEYVCEDVDQYLTKGEQLTDNILKTLQQEAEDCIDSYLADNVDHISNDKLTYEGSYILASKNKDSWYGSNIIYVIYSTQISSKDTYDYDYPEEGITNGAPYFAPTKVYMPVSFENVICQTDGDVDYSMSSSIQGYTDLKLGWGNVCGYTDSDKMQQELITKNKVNYKAEVVGGLKDSTTAADVSSTDDETSEDYILPNSSTAYITAADLASLSADQLRIARNEIYARHGRKFDDESLKKYFESKTWYSGTVDADDITDDMLNEYEKANLELIKQMEGSN